MDVYQATLDCMYRKYGRMTLTLKEAAVEAHRDYDEARKLAIEGKFPARKTGGRWEVCVALLVAHLAAPADPQAAPPKPSSSRWRRRQD